MWTLSTYSPGSNAFQGHCVGFKKSNLITAGLTVTHVYERSRWMPSNAGSAPETILLISIELSLAANDRAANWDGLSRVSCPPHWCRGTNLSVCGEARVAGHVLQVIVQQSARISSESKRYLAHEVTDASLAKSKLEKQRTSQNSFSDFGTFFPFF